jgi:hypothetical protein
MDICSSKCKGKYKGKGEVMKVKILIEKRVSLKKGEIYNARKRDERSLWVKDNKGDEWVVLTRDIQGI